MDLISGIGAAKHALDIAKALKNVEKNYDDATFKIQIIDLISALTDARLALAEAKEEMAARDHEIERLKNAFAVKGELVKGDGDYRYFVSGDGLPSGYPICPSCDQVEGRIIQLKQKVHYYIGSCPSCDKEFSPVTCYLPDGDTAAKQAKRAQEAAQRRVSERIAELNSGSGPSPYY